MTPFRLILILLLLPGSLLAHDLRLLETADALVLVRGHEASSEHGAPTATCPVEQILGVRALFADEAPSVEIPPAARLRFERAPIALVVTVSSGCWTKTADGTVNLSADQVASPLMSWRSFESTKLLLGWRQDLTEPLADRLEISPLNNPLRLAKGRKLRLAVTRDGQPVAGAVVVHNDRVRGETDKQGRINLKIREPGLQTITATSRVPVVGDVVDQEIHHARLEFRVEEK
jgi:nickel transport protein